MSVGLSHSLCSGSGSLRPVVPPAGTPNRESSGLRSLYQVFGCCRSVYSFFRMILNISNVFLFAAFGDCSEAFAASSNVLSVMFLGSPMSSPGFPHPQLQHMERFPFIDYYGFFIIFFAGFFSPVFMGIIFFIFLNCSSVKIVRISFMAFNISK